MTFVLVDTSVWVEHFHSGHPHLAHLLAQDQVLMHPMVLGEIACGTPPDRLLTLKNLSLLRPMQVATVDEAIRFVEIEQLFGHGCGLVDMLLLASTIITPGAQLWSLDKRLSALAERIGVSYQPEFH
jgi:predicted nucleic acid-binding protein